MSASYPASLKSFTNPVAGNNLNSPPHATQHADENDEIVAIQTELGIVPKGTYATVKARLDDAVYKVGVQTIAGVKTFSSLPTIPLTPSATTDASSKGYVDTAVANASSKSNVIYTWTGAVDPSISIGYVSSTSNIATAASNTYVYQMVGQSISSSITVLRSKWTKIAGVSTLTVYANLWKRTSGQDMKCQIDVGSISGSSAAVSATAPSNWVTWTLTVSTLTNGTTYDLTVGLYNPTAAGGDNSYAYLGGIVIMGS